MTTREILLDMLMEILENGKFCHHVIGAVLYKYAYLSRSDRAFLKRVCTGCVERKIQLDYVLDQFSSTKTARMKPVIRTILRMGVYQILYMDKVPDSAACNESVKLAARKGFGNLKGFVNGVLRNIARHKDSIRWPEREKDEIAYLEIMYSMPAWIITMWAKTYGMAKTEQILKGLLEERPLTIRLDESLDDAEKSQLLFDMEQAGVKARPFGSPDYAYQISNMDSPEKIPGYSGGKWMVQDPGSMMVTQFAGIREGDVVIDVCGAPGGKALHAAAKTGRKGHVYVRDLTPDKISMIEENLKRTSYRNVTVQMLDATVMDEDSLSKADVLIADLPCSGLGVIGRKPDIKYRIRPEDLDHIAALQRQILMTVSGYVKKGGILLYSTCTINKKENEENAAFITQNLPFKEEETKQLLPGIDQTDGFFMARFKRI